MVDWHNENVATSWNTGNIALVWGRLRWDNLPFRERQVALCTNRDDQVFPVGASEMKTVVFVATYAKFGFDRQNQHSSAE